MSSARSTDTGAIAISHEEAYILASWLAFHNVIADMVVNHVITPTQAFAARDQFISDTKVLANLGILNEGKEDQLSLDPTDNSFLKAAAELGKFMDTIFPDNELSEEDDD